jgi:hypothetical protein
MEKEFYKNLKLFLKDLVVVFPEDDEALQIISTTINLAIIEDTDKLIIKKFYNSLLPIESQIYNKDNIIFSSDIAKYWPQSSYEYRLFSKIQQNFDSFSQHNQNILWDYIIVLFKLAKSIIEKN